MHSRIAYVLLSIASLLLLTAAAVDALNISFRKSADYVQLGTSSVGCAANGTTASSPVMTAGTWRMSVLSETVAICDAQDADCASAPMDLVPGTQIDLKISAVQAAGAAGTAYWHCRSAGGTGYVVFRKIN